MRQRLDLDALLRKYETISSPIHDQPYLSPRMLPKAKVARLKTQSTYYPQNDLKYFNSVANFAQPRDRQYRDKAGSTNFQMSKSECEGLLLSMKEELSEQQRSMEGFVSDCIGQLMHKFEKEHQQLRRELMNLVDHSLQLSKRSAMELIQGYRRHFPKEYKAVNKKIAAANEEINSLLAGLSGSGYKKTIAEVVTRDFGDMMKHMKEEIQLANSNYRQGLTSIELDRSKLAKIQQSLQKIYVWRAREEIKSTQDRDDGVLESRRSSKRKIFDQKGPNKLAMTERHSDHSDPKQMRRTFFNFDSNN